MTFDQSAVLDRAAHAAAPRTLVDILQETVRRHPEASAIDDGAGPAVSYRELAARVALTASRLVAAGVRHGDRVGIRMTSGTKELYIAILGVMAAGAAYVPVDADDTEERAALVFGEAGVRGVITGRGLYSPSAHASGEDAAEPSDVTAEIPTIDDSVDEEADEDEDLFAGEAPAGHTRALDVLAQPSPDDDAWIIFTSGSTGVPKGVAVTHRCAAAFVDAESRLFLQEEPLGTSDRVLAGLSVAFDASCEEMWLAWAHGACLVPAPRALVRSGVDLANWLARQGITVISTVPTLAAMWPSSTIDNVRLLIFGGEAVPPELGTRLAAEGREVWNTYGPTEATVVSCAAPLVPDAPVRIGLPLEGWSLAVVDAEGVPVSEASLTLRSVPIATLRGTLTSPLNPLDWPSRAFV
ncbi:MAG TPA: hypothetical protein EYQ02_06825, partial [Microbacterium sp.]|nr:hypothetical protein [Microbacterium sp.]